MRARLAARASPRLLGIASSGCLPSCLRRGTTRLPQADSLRLSSCAPSACTSGAGVPTRGTCHWRHPLRVERTSWPDASSFWPLMKIHSYLHLLRQHTCLLYTTACAPPCGDSIIIPLLAVPIALYRIAAGALGRCLHLRLRDRSSMRWALSRALEQLRRRLATPLGSLSLLGEKRLLLLALLLAEDA